MVRGKRRRGRRRKGRRRRMGEEGGGGKGVSVGGWLWDSTSFRLAPALHLFGAPLALSLIFFRKSYVLTDS